MRKMSYWRFSWRSISYFFVASKMVRPGQLYRLSALVLQTKTPLTVRASIQCNGVEIGAANSNIKVGILENLMIKDIAGLQALSAIGADISGIVNGPPQEKKRRMLHLTGEGGCSNTAKLLIDFSVYVNTNRERTDTKKVLDLEFLVIVIEDLKPTGPRLITKTWCGY